MEAIAMENFKERLNKLTQEKLVEGIKNQNAIATGMHMSPSTFSYLLKNGGKPSYETIQTLSDYFGVSVDYLLGNSNMRIPEAEALCNTTLDFLKVVLDRCATRDTDIIGTLNRLLPAVITKFEEQNGELGTKILRDIADVLQAWSDFIIDVIPNDISNFSDPGYKQAAILRLYESGQYIGNRYIESGKGLIDSLYSGITDIHKEGNTNGDST
jgi:transcriptional regulator with XRE-family HTH domain